MTTTTPRVFVTGVGIISPAGAGGQAYWDGLCSTAPLFDELPVLYAGMKPGALGAWVPQSAREAAIAATKTELGAKPRMAEIYAAYAATEAIEDAGLLAGDPSLSPRSMVCVGTSDGQADVLEAICTGVGDGSTRFSSAGIASSVAEVVGSIGPAFVVNATCASTNAALSCARDALTSGISETAVVVGCDAYSQKNIIGFSSLQAIGPTGCRPFSRDRRFVTPAEGAGALVLQTERSLCQDQRPYAELVAASISNDASHPTAPDPAGVRRCHRRALDEAGLEASLIDVIYAHGTGSRVNDEIEGRIFVDDFPHAAVTAVKGTIGHMMGAAGAAGAVAACLTLRHRLVPPTVVDSSEIELELNLVTGAARPVPNVRYVQNNAFGFGGNNAISIFRQVS
ncbi:beta-ketoacyl synthase N-terminal-like domain-containing protein [Streptomyces turgidiscabies]|uniref:3-oxoacyl-[acyl-carrier-protein] synthase II n=1 Tax=Streptomyces turgidiscabies TaxID=85558 RepID=A0ABU0RTQ2_9ACTN|nr:beta-ketoacyl synthase N-terminal-like domain-containing protein [Streptomyces turgidiscabies]MDQ0935377.1 3-oxoacyl-[acyl-carrier-protein] synthase II [Streptomyces turgidiscabies]